MMIDRLINQTTDNEFYSIKFIVTQFSANTNTFDIHQIKFDNNNGTTNGVKIVATNRTAYARLYFLTSIQSLDYLELDLVNYIRNGTLVDGDLKIKIIVDENIRLTAIYLVSLVSNENIESLS